MTLVAGSGGEAVLHRHTVVLLHITNTLCKTNVCLEQIYRHCIVHGYSTDGKLNIFNQEASEEIEQQCKTPSVI